MTRRRRFVVRYSSIVGGRNSANIRVFMSIQSVGNWDWRAYQADAPCTSESGKRCRRSSCDQFCAVPNCSYFLKKIPISSLSRLPNFGIGTAPLLFDDVIASAISFPSSLIEILVDIPDALLPLAGLLWLGIPPLACLICEDTFPDVLGVLLVDGFVIVLVTGAVVAGGRDVAADLVSLIGVDWLWSKSVLGLVMLRWTFVLLFLEFLPESLDFREESRVYWFSYLTFWWNSNIPNRLLVGSGTRM